MRLEQYHPRAWLEAPPAHGTGPVPSATSSNSQEWQKAASATRRGCGKGGCGRRTQARRGTLSGTVCRRKMPRRTRPAGTSHIAAHNAEGRRGRRRAHTWATTTQGNRHWALTAHLTGTPSLGDVAPVTPIPPRPSSSRPGWRRSLLLAQFRRAGCRTLASTL